MTSTITLYQDCKIIPSKNFVVDSLEDYLSTLDRVSISNFQYIRNDLHCYIKISKDQDFVGSYSYYNYNYLKVIQDGVNYYYFIVKKTQLSQNTIGYELLMDTLNTYKWGTAFNVSPRTRVIREHKDRMFPYVTLLHFLTPLPEGYPYWFNVLHTGKLHFIFGDNDETYTTDELNIRFRLTPIASRGFNISNISERDSSFFWEHRGDDNCEVVSIIVNGVEYAIEGRTFAVIHFRYKYLRNIDYYPEGFNPVLYKKELGLLTDNKNNTAWDLVYKNATDADNSAIDCLAIPEENTLFSIPANSNPDYSQFEDGKYYLFAPWGNASFGITDSNDNYYFVGSDYASGGMYALYCCGIRRSGSHLYIISIRFNGCFMKEGKWVAGYQGRQFIGEEREITSISFDLEELYYVKGDSYFNPTLAISLNYLPDSNGNFSAVSSTTYDMKILSEVDRVDSKLVKIISIPYFPTNYEFTEGVMYSLTDAWTFNISEKTLQLNDLDINFTANIETNIESPLNVFEVSPSLQLTDLRNDENESKLYHSDFYQPKFVYDSFGFVFALERMDAIEYNKIESFTFNFEFIMTATINSKFLFRFPQYILKLSTEDYDNILPIARNNERPIYHSSYITYLRTAYRYDLKEKYQNTKLAGYNMGIGIGNTLSEAYGSAGPKNAFGGIWSGLTNLAGTFINGLFKLNNLEWNLQSKIDCLKAQANSVSGSDDLDLMEAYASNRAKLCLYEVSPRMKEMLGDLFYYFGYTTEEFKIPLINTRVWFNFVACEIEFTGIDYNIKEEIKEDIIKRFSDGATFLHMKEINSVKTWDFDQVKENWETSLLP